ncbi:MAG: carbohydrate ABC transporter permease [Oscillospiraceae bacterium]|nr:carbohydrate ABC transporter permease [Oscillospiraceae bacterium]
MTTQRDRKQMEGFHKNNRIPVPVNVIFSCVFIFLAAICVLPLIFVIIISLSTEESIQRIGYSFFPQGWTGFAYEYVMNSSETVGRAFLVSIGVTVTGTIFGLMMNSSMGYVLSRASFKLKKHYTMIIFIPMLFSGGLVASYMVITQFLGLTNTYGALILPIGVTPFYIIILRTFFQTTVPDSIIESVKVDGGNQFLIFFRIVLPISLPALATIGLFLSFAYWNDWFMALLYIRSTHMQMYPLQYVLISIERNMDFLLRNAEFFGAAMDGGARLPAEAVRMALVVIAVLPIACSYPFFQRYFISGLTIGAVKG